MQAYSTGSLPRPSRLQHRDPSHSTLGIVPGGGAAAGGLQGLQGLSGSRGTPGLMRRGTNNLNSPKLNHHRFPDMYGGEQQQMVVVSTPPHYNIYDQQTYNNYRPPFSSSPVQRPPFGGPPPNGPGLIGRDSLPTEAILQQP